MVVVVIDYCCIIHVINICPQNKVQSIWITSMMCIRNRESNNYSFNKLSSMITRKWVIGDMRSLMGCRRRMRSLIVLRIVYLIMGRIKLLPVRINININHCYIIIIIFSNACWMIIIVSGMKCLMGKWKRCRRILWGRKGQEQDRYCHSMIKININLKILIHHDFAGSRRLTNFVVRKESVKHYRREGYLMKINKRNLYLLKKNIIINR